MIALIVVGGCLGIAFVIWGKSPSRIAARALLTASECWTTLDYPLIPVKHLNRQFAAIVVDGCGGGFVYISMSVIWPSIISALYTTDVTYTGWLSVCLPTSHDVQKC